MPNSTTKVEHRKEALNELELAVQAKTGSDAQAFALCAQAHASLAIAEELRGIREALEGVIWTNQLPRGGVDRKLRVTNA